ncbi:glycoside hydrolase superfamily [Jimgerdemannia flammicorona]|uniref:1,4-alpha-glucan-branching enzyme n=1 Tax=Jimgerdemannia flammicorona TaxID=994334 RepID=A0A433D7I7_9FUNG|nr:glycoside hydrolase superfamily [Jimgerdemannia flammicorona]
MAGSDVATFQAEVEPGRFLTMQEDGTGVAVLDPWLEPFKDSLRRRFGLFKNWVNKINETSGGYEQFTRGYEYFGLNYSNANLAFLQIYQPDNWDASAHPMKKDNFGVFHLTLPAKSDGTTAIAHGSKIKIAMFIPPHNERIDRLPAWSKYVTQDLSVSPCYDSIFWNPPTKYLFKNKPPKKPESLRVYEAHVGIATTEGRVGTYMEFTKNLLPRISRLGYNTIQLMAVMEHAYYASFGYQVTSFFAASSRYGPPEHLQELIDTAHGLGITVLLDVVHSHACKNVLDGLNMFDGTDHCYFHEGGKGRHDLWDSRLFNYGAYEPLRFLMSNLRYWMETFQFDGFRFDGVTSMMYIHHGMGVGFSGNYNEYFNYGVDEEGVVYLMLANDMLHNLYPNVITIAEGTYKWP